MTTNQMQTIRLIAEVIRKTASEEVQARLISCLLSCDGREELDDDEAETGMELFDSLCEICGPDVVDMAQDL